MTKTGSFAPFNGDLAEQRYSELYDRYKRHLAWVGVVIIAIGAGVWFYLRSESIKSQHAETAFQAAIQSVSAGNIPLAESDLKKAAARYEGTNGGAQASMALAKIYYQQDKYQDGIAALTKVAGDGGDLQYGARLLVAGGYEGLKKWVEAAKEYEAAAAAARFDADRNGAKAMAARSYEAGGDKASAVRLWTEIASDSTYSTEAKIRLGELQATAIKV